MSRKKIPVAIDHKLRVELDVLPQEVVANIINALTIPNQEKIEAQKQQLWGWQQLPDVFSLYDLNDDGWLVMPRGFARALENGIKLSGMEVDWIDRRTNHYQFSEWEEPLTQLKPWQGKAGAAICDYTQGIYKAPAGSGKTVTILHTIARLNRKALIIVNTKDIVWQWQERIKEHLGDGYDVGQIGDGVFEVGRDITIATAQTLNSRFERLQSEGFFHDFGFVCLDECHHATAETYNKIMNSFSAMFRVGVSATPDKTGDFALAKHVLGPVFHETKPQDVDMLIKPKVVRVATHFQFPFHGHRSRWQRSNYPQMIEAMIRDEMRNEIIVSGIIHNKGHHQLVISKRLEHLDLLHDMLMDKGFQDPIRKLTGESSNEERKAAKALVENEPSVILSTLADEAMDIPRLDRIHLTFPQKNPGLVTQQVGRVERKHPDKEDAIIYDYADTKIGVLEAQWRTRRFEVYENRGYQIELWR